MPIGRIRWFWVLPALPAMLSGEYKTSSGLLRMIEAADSIMVGTVTHFDFEGPRMGIAVAADRVLKGGAPGSYVLTTTLPAAWVRRNERIAANRKSVLLGKRALMFVRRNGANLELIFPKDTPKVVEDYLYDLPPQYVVPAARAADSIQDAVVRVFASHVEALPKGGTPFINSRERITALARHTRTRPGAATQELIQDLLKSPDQDMQQFGILMRIAQQDLSAPGLIETAQAKLDPLRLEGAANQFREEYENLDTLAVRGVARLFQSAKTDHLREACIWVLARIHTRASLPALAAALESPNAAIRGAAARGMGGFANNMPPGSHSMTPGTVALQKRRNRREGWGKYRAARSAGSSPILARLVGALQERTDRAMRSMLSALFSAMALAQIATLTPDLRLKLIPACMLRDDVELTGADHRAFRSECTALQRNITGLATRLRAQQGQRPPSAQEIVEANRQREELILKSCAQLDRILTLQGRRALRAFLLELQQNTTTIRLGAR